MKKYEVIEKLIGETPLQALEKLRQKNSDYSYLPMTYAGRLDPMAKGKLLILIGEECKNRNRYDGLDKEYEVEILFGLKTDSADVLGKIIEKRSDNIFSESNISRVAKSFLGKRDVPYPNFSSKPVNGKPMFQHAVLDNLENIEIPVSKMHIKKINLLNLSEISLKSVKMEAESKISKLQLGELDSRVGSGFRKEEILNEWKNLEMEGSKMLRLAKFRVISASGGYMRVFAEMLAEKLGTVGLAFSINRTKIGKYFGITDNFGFWTKQY